MNQPAFSEEDFLSENLFYGPDVYPLQFEGPNTIFVRMTEDSYRQSIFTDFQRIVSPSNQALRVPTMELLGQHDALGMPEPKLGYIFHVAHCGSTLLARALDEGADLLVCREPSTLRQLGAEFAATTEDPPANAIWPRRLRLATALLGRRYRESQAVVIKGNVPVNFMLPELMGLNDQSSAILLYAPLRNYLLSVLKSPQHQQWVSHVSGELSGGIRRTPGLADITPTALSVPQQAACLWLAQTIRFRELVAANKRVRTLNCEDLFEQPAATLAAAFALFDVAVEAERIDSIVSGSLFSQHSKSPGVAYDNATRKAELKKLELSLGEQISEGMAWVETLDVPSDLLGPLPAGLLQS